MARGPARSRWPLWLVAVVLVAPLAYALYPVRIVVEGVATIQPAFEDLVVMPDVSGMVTRVRVSPVQDVEQGTPLFEYIPDGQYAVQTHFTPTRPGTSRDAPAPLPEWYRGPGAPSHERHSTPSLDHPRLLVSSRAFRSGAPSVFVRLRLAEAPPREILGTPVLFTLTSPARPRLWFWLKAQEPIR